MRAANRQGPARSPMALETPSADSVKADDHWAMVASDAPAQTMSRMRSQKSGSRSSFFVVLPSWLSGSRSMGQVRKLKVLARGMAAQKRARSFQFSTPNRAKKRVEPRMTPTAPQQ